MMRAITFVCVLMLTVARLASAQGNQPPLGANDWNFVLIPAFESARSANPLSNSNNLSVQGLNHALRFAQLLNTNLAGKLGQLRGVYAFTSADNDKDLTPLETVEPFALLNNLAVKVQALNNGDATVYNSPAYYFQQLLANQARGTYVIAMPLAMLQETVATLSQSGSPLHGKHQYVVLSGQGQPFAYQAYQDQIADDPQYPAIALPKPSACSQPKTVLNIPLPEGLKAYKSQTVYLVRHVEAHPTGNFENGNYVCQGQWRALGANASLLRLMKNQKPDYIFTNNPNNLIDCGQTCSYIRPTMTVAPFAIAHDLPLSLAEFQWNDAIDLGQALMNTASPYFQRPNKPTRILVGWEHAHLEKAVKYIVNTLYKNPGQAAKLPAWGFGDYDSVWELSTDERGNLTFSNSCEGIASAQLPSTCPAFLQ